MQGVVSECGVLAIIFLLAHLTLCRRSSRNQFLGFDDTVETEEGQPHHRRHYRDMHLAPPQLHVALNVKTYFLYD